MNFADHNRAAMQESASGAPSKSINNLGYGYGDYSAPQTKVVPVPTNIGAPIPPLVVSAECQRLHNLPWNHDRAAARFTAGGFITDSASIPPRGIFGPMSAQGFLRASNDSRRSEIYTVNGQNPRGPRILGLENLLASMFNLANNWGAEVAEMERQLAVAGCSFRSVGTTSRASGALTHADDDDQDSDPYGKGSGDAGIQPSGEVAAGFSFSLPELVVGGVIGAVLMKWLG